MIVTISSLSFLGGAAETCKALNMSFPKQVAPDLLSSTVTAGFHSLSSLWPRSKCRNRARVLQITIRKLSQGSHRARTRLRLSVLRGKNPKSASLFHCAHLGRLKGGPVANASRSDQSATVDKTATAKMQSDSKQNWVPTRFDVGPFMGPAFWPVFVSS